MRAEILRQASGLALDTPGLVMPLLIAEGLNPSKSAAYGRVAVELQLEDREMRQQIVNDAQRLKKLLELGESIGLVKQGEYLDERWLNRIPHQSRYSPDPILGILSVLNEHIEILERKILIWKSYMRHPRFTANRREIVRNALMDLSPGPYEARFRLRGIEPYKPLEPYNGNDYRSQVENPQSFNPSKVARVNHAFRLERASERALSRVKPTQLAAYTERWWKMRYQKFISDEPQPARNQRMAALMSKYGVGLKEAKTLNVGSGSSGSYEPFELMRSADTDYIASRTFDPREFEAQSMTCMRMGVQQLNPDGTMQLRTVKPWIATERSAPPPKRYTPTLDVGSPEIQTAIELLASLSSRFRCFAGFEEIRDAGRADSVRQHVSKVVPEVVVRRLETSPGTSAESTFDRSPVPNVRVSGPSESSARSTGLTVVPQSDGRYMLRLARQFSPEACLDRARPSVFEIELCRSPRKGETLAEYVTKLLRHEEVRGRQGTNSELGTDFITGLLDSGRVIAMQNIRFQPSSVEKPLFLKFDLADGAAFRDVAFDGRAVIARIRGNSADFENVHLGDLSVDVRLFRASWRNCHALPGTRMRGSLGESRFDSRCVIPWDASELDMRFAHFDADNLQSRLGGMIVSPEMLPAPIRGQLSLSGMSAAEIQECTRRGDVFSRKDVVSILMGLEPRVLFYSGKGEVRAHDVDNLLALRRSRDRISIPSGSASHALCILFGDLAKGEPHRSILDTFVQTEQQPARVSTDLGSMQEWGLGDRGVLFAALDFIYEGRVRLPVVAGIPAHRYPSAIGGDVGAPLFRVNVP
jgi:hypothetical protein